MDDGDSAGGGFFDAVLMHRAGLTWAPHKVREATPADGRGISMLIERGRRVYVADGDDE